MSAPAAMSVVSFMVFLLVGDQFTPLCIWFHSMRIGDSELAVGVKFATSARIPDSSKEKNCHWLCKAHRIKGALG
jgi:hypothetical protein